MSSEDYIAPPFFTIISALFILSVATLFGRIRDVFYFLLNPGKLKKQNEGYAPIRDPTEDFYMRRMYGRIVDCWNRPICSAPDAWVDVMERTRAEDTTGVEVASIVPTGGSRRCLNLSSYNYLGFAASDPYCTPRVQDTIQQLGVSSCSSRVHGGTTSAHTELEELVARFLGVEAALTYGMGFATNSSTIPALVGKGCLILSDALNHSSIVAGTRQSGAKVKVFRHNDAPHLDALLRQSIAEGQPRSHRPWKKIMVIVEGVYSMEGEACCLKEIVEVAKKYKAYIYLDEAHSIGALGRTGRGCCEHWGVDPNDIDIMMGTFTKSFGSCGGYVAGKRETVEYLRRHSPAHLYACSMAPGCVKQVTSALEVMMGLDGSDRGAKKVAQLHDNANYVRSRLLEMGMDVLGSWDSPVMPIMTYNAAKMVALSRICLERSLAMVIVGFPATPVLLTRARICISAAHTREDLDWALSVLDEVADLCLLRYRTQALYTNVEADLKDHVARHFGPALAAEATIAGLAAGSFDMTRARAALRAPAGAKKQGSTGGAKDNGEQVQHEQQPAAKRTRTVAVGEVAAKTPASVSVKLNGVTASVTPVANGYHKASANGTVGAHAKAFVKARAVVAAK
ncbi:hypothetical protein GPECTOR_31g337 [Gonium pectorale]|uniref:serine C-palmitoyltransferase n=1 Tax=Gonium pectorale TaxID=33097 RepID=A0A150GEI0_GONPE|nr:hypothetical protein GPECTOR_31g337 [Gonium pectorale]|eukprot:KXZ47975.1 hypothetical protein GPECTOR_31g337 [Gonium pectorale]